MYCIYHSRDLDGWCSAAIVKKWFREKYSDGVVLSKETHDQNPKPNNYLYMIGWDYGDVVPDLSKEDIILVDISFPKNEMFKLWHRLDKKTIWIDHHISAINDNKDLVWEQSHGIQNTKKAACELTWEYLFPNEKIPEFVRLLGRYDCFGHKGTSEEQRVLEFQYAARAYCKNVEDCFEKLHQKENQVIGLLSELGKGIYKYLCVEAEQDYKTRFTVDFDGYKFACINRKRFNPINFGIQYHNDKADDIYYYDGAACFHYENGLWNFSLYNDNGKVDCSEICKKRGGGGHAGAAGFRVSNINNIINKI